MQSAVVVCSGGLDSVTLAHYVIKRLKYRDVTLVFFDYGQHSRRIERRCAQHAAHVLGAQFFEVKLKELRRLAPSALTVRGRVRKITRKALRTTAKEGARWYVPFRNGIFLSYALALATSLGKRKKVTVFIGFKSEGHEPYPDTTQAFVRQMNALSRVATHGIMIKAPFIEKDKEDIIRLGVRLGVDFTKTVSCYVAGTRACGKCLACALRKEGFYWAGMRDPTEYR